MKRKTSITLSADVLSALDHATRKDESRSTAIERLLRQTLAADARRRADLRDLDLINRHADALNREIDDVLAYQGEEGLRPARGAGGQRAGGAPPSAPRAGVGPREQ